MAVPRTRSAFNEPIIGDACALDPSNSHHLPTKRDVLTDEVTYLGETT